jgi:bud site selection protein 20
MSVAPPKPGSQRNPELRKRKPTRQNIHNNNPSPGQSKQRSDLIQSSANMGTAPSAKKFGSRSKLKKYKRGCWLKNRARDTDQIQDEIEKSQETGKPIAFEYDDELPGGGKFYCVETGKHFTDARALSDHKKSRYYKKRCKGLKEEKYTQDVAEWAAGMSKEKLPPAHPKK